MAELRRAQTPLPPLSPDLLTAQDSLDQLRLSGDGCGIDGRKAVGLHVGVVLGGEVVRLRGGGVVGVGFRKCRGERAV